MSRRSAWVLLAAAAWTLYVWSTRLWIMAGQDESFGFKAVHAVLAVVSIGFGVAVGVIGWRALRAPRTPREAGATVQAAPANGPRTS